MTYDEAITWLLSFADFERSGRFQDRPDVAPMLSLLERLGNPHLGRTTVHITGSKGKGSVAAMVEQVLTDTYERTGLYTSPHLYSYCERIRIDGSPITEVEFSQLAARLEPIVRAAQSELDERQFVTFDLLTAMAFLCFKEHSANVQVVEVGLGGRVDSTNVFNKKRVAVITPISLEHTAILGDSVEEIAREKAAIITQECIAVMAPQTYTQAASIVRQAAFQQAARLIDVGLAYSWQRLSHDLRGQMILIEGPHGVIEAKLPLFGAHQIENAATAVACLDWLFYPKSRPANEDIKQSLASVRWPCRIEVLREHPLLIADGAHNRDSARRLAETLVEYFACDRTLFVIGCGSDKDVEGLAEELAPLASRVFAVRSEHPRAMPPQRVAEAFGRLSVDAEIAENVPAAVNSAIAAAGAGALICVAGSLFVAAEARGHVLGLKAGP